MKNPPRLMPALVTPFDRRGELDSSAHAHNVGALAEMGIEGFLVAGSTGEGSLLEPGERSALVEGVRSALGAKPFVIVGVWAESVRQAQMQISEASDADAVLVVTPTTLARRSVAVQVDYFGAVAESSPLPVLLYSVPPNTGYALDLTATIELASHANIVGMKDSGGDAVRIQQIIDGAPDDFIMFSGASRSISLVMAAGGHGAITASTNFAPRRLMELVTNARKSPRKAIEMQSGVTELCASVESHGIPGVKAGAAAIGLQPGYPRAPLSRLPKRRAAAIEKLLA